MSCLRQTVIQKVIRFSSLSLCWPCRFEAFTGIPVSTLSALRAESVFLFTGPEPTRLFFFTIHSPFRIIRGKKGYHVCICLNTN